MTLDEAKTVFAAMRGNWANYNPTPGHGNSSAYITLDGDFTAVEIEAIGVLMNQPDAKKLLEFR